MTKGKVNSLIALMALAMLGIIVLQGIWMKNAIQVRNELFDRSVNEALTQSSKKLETLNDVFFVQDMVSRDQHKRIIPKPGNSFHFNSEEIIVNGDTILLKYNSKSPHLIHANEKVQIINSEKNDSIHSEVQVEIFQMDSVITKWEEKIDHNITVMFDNSIQQLEDDSTLRIQKRVLARQFGDKAQRLKDVAGKMVFESWVMDRVRLPDTLAINKILKQELSDRAIPIPYELGVFYGKDKLLKTAFADSSLLVKSTYRSSLFPGEIFDKGEVLSIYFPSRRAFILKTLLWPGILSFIFCVFIMVVFGLSIYYIMNQKKVSEMKSDFINNMTHELKTPLATISVASDTIVNAKVIGDPHKVRHFTGVIKKENQRMNQQVESILQIARLDKKDFDFNFKVVNIQEIIKKSIQIYSFQVENRGGTIKTHFNANNTMVTTDGIHCLNVLNNLLDNACKYSPEKPEIELSTRNDERGIWISISDKGIGMNRQVQQKIFEKFYRETSGNVHNVKGFGLGLSYAKAVVEANKGNIVVKSESGKGSTFEVFIPFTLAS